MTLSLTITTLVVSALLLLVPRLVLALSLKVLMASLEVLIPSLISIILVMPLHIHLLMMVLLLLRLDWDLHRDRGDLLQESRQNVVGWVQNCRQGVQNSCQRIWLLRCLLVVLLLLLLLLLECYELLILLEGNRVISHRKCQHSPLLFEDLLLLLRG